MSDVSDAVFRRTDRGMPENVRTPNNTPPDSQEKYRRNEKLEILILYHIANDYRHR